MDTSSTVYCPKCGSPLAGAVLNGLCPDCLGLVAFDRQENPGDTTVSPAQKETTKPALSATVRYIGDYELQEEIGRGGMGVVYRARQASLNRIVAVKMILAGQFAGPSERQRFQREAEAAAHLRHPNIVTIHEVGEHQGRSYFSMDLIEGRTLGAALREGRLAPAAAAQLVKTLAEAVHYAHQRGTLHRDLKPQNVLMDAEGQPHILDFGLARQIEGGAELTRTGDVVGSPTHMPPEQATGNAREVGPASDVYSLGAILYEAVTGRAPFQGNTVAEVLRQVIEADPVSPRRCNASVPADLETICLKCLEKRPDQRYHSARALAEELERFLKFEPILARPASLLRKTWNWSQQNPWVLAAMSGLLVLLLGCIAYGFWEKSRFLAWRLDGSPDTPVRIELSPSLLFFQLFPGICYLLYFAGNALRKAYGRSASNQGPVPAAQLLFHGVLGATGAAVGMGFLLLQIRAWVWQIAPDAPVNSAPLFALDAFGVLCALILNWMGFRMVWEAVGMHETSRFRKRVDQAFERQLADESRRWPVMKLVGFALWLPFAAWGMSLLVLGWIWNTRGLDMVIGIIGVLLSAGVVALLAWVIRKRLRLFTFVFAPLALAIFCFALAVVALNPRVVANLFGYSVLSAIVALPALLFFKRPPSSDGAAGGRFPGNPWLDAAGGAALLVAALVLFHLVENWRGARVWARVRTDLGTRGESLDLASFRRPHVPDAENIMAHPYLTKYFLQGTEHWPVSTYDANGIEGSPSSPFALTAVAKLPRRSTNGSPSLEGILAWYAKFQRDFEPLEEALGRPAARLAGDPDRLMEMPIPNVVSFRRAANAYADLTQVHLLVSDPDAALKDLRMMRRLMVALGANDPPILVSTMVKVAAAGLMARTIKDTMGAGLWPQTHWAQLQELCEGVDLLADVSVSLRGGERAGVIRFVQSLSEGGWHVLFSGGSPTNAARARSWTLESLIMPKGWADQSCAVYARLLQLNIQGLDLAKRRFDPAAIEAGSQQVGAELSTGHFRPYYALAAVAIPNTGKAFRATARNQTLLDQARVACALERYRAVQGSYPADLDALTPEYLAAVPRDLINGEKLRYLRSAPDQYLLYAIGWNGRDDQGRIGQKPEAYSDWSDTDGDWVWLGAPKDQKAKQ